MHDEGMREDLMVGQTYVRGIERFKIDIHAGVWSLLATAQLVTPPMKGMRGV